MNDDPKPHDEAAPAAPSTAAAAAAERPGSEPELPGEGLESGDAGNRDGDEGSRDGDEGSRDGDERNSDADERNSDERVSLASVIPAKAALPLALGVTIVLAVVLRLAFDAEQAGTWTMLLLLFGAHLPLAVLALAIIAKEGKIKDEVRPRAGDLTFGALLGALVYGAAMAGRQLFVGVDSPRNWWIGRIYLQLGDMSDNRIHYIGSAVFVIAVMEELVWRGLVMRTLRKSLGPMRAWLLSSVLYALAHVATIQLLAHPVAGPNPLLVAGALGCGLVWGHLYNRTGRLTPSLFAHGLFSWAFVVFPLWRP